VVVACVQMKRVRERLRALERNKRLKMWGEELYEQYAARMAKAARRREAINARTAQLRSEARAVQTRGDAVAARPASSRRQLKPTRRFNGTEVARKSEQLSESRDEARVIAMHNA